MKFTTLLFLIAMAIGFSHPILAQDSSSKARPASIVKLSVGNPIMYLLYPRFEMKYAGIGYEWFRNKKTSFNGYLDYFYIPDGSYNSPAGYYYGWQLDNYGRKNIVSLRTLYKWYPLHKIKYARGLYIAGGINGAIKYTYKKGDDIWGDSHKLDIYAGLGWGMGYRIEVKKKLSLEIYYHAARNGIALESLISPLSYEPIRIDLIDFSIGYVLSKKNK